MKKKSLREEQKPLSALLRKKVRRGKGISLGERSSTNRKREKIFFREKRDKQGSKGGGKEATPAEGRRRKKKGIGSRKGPEEVEEKPGRKEIAPIR